MFNHRRVWYFFKDLGRRFKFLGHLFLFYHGLSISVFTLCSMSIYTMFYANRPYEHQFVTLRKSDVFDGRAMRVEYFNNAESCRTLCSNMVKCQMYAYTTNTYVCKLFDKDAQQLQLIPTDDPATSLHIKIFRGVDGFLESDGHVYWMFLNVMSYQQAVLLCKSVPSYQLAVVQKNNRALEAALSHYKTIQASDRHKGLKLGLFLADGMIIPPPTAGILANSKEDQFRKDSQGNYYLNRALYVTTSASFISSDSSVMGYPFCQGTPFNQRAKASVNMDITKVIVKLPMRTSSI